MSSCQLSYFKIYELIIHVVLAFSKHHWRSIIFARNRTFDISFRLFKQKAIDQLLAHSSTPGSLEARYCSNFLDLSSYAIIYSCYLYGLIFFRFSSLSSMIHLRERIGYRSSIIFYIIAFFFV